MQIKRKHLRHLQNLREIKKTGYKNSKACIVNYTAILINIRVAVLF